MALSALVLIFATIRKKCETERVKVEYSHLWYVFATINSLVIINVMLKVSLSISVMLYLLVYRACCVSIGGFMD